MAARTLEFANLTFTFGSKRVLIDLFAEVVLPAFTDATLLRRTRANSTYIFRDVELLDLGTDTVKTPAICGRFIHDTNLVRDQVIDEATGTVKKDKRAMESAPSAVFVLLVENHRLLYLHETAAAPTLEIFRTTLLNFLTQKYLGMVEYLHLLQPDGPNRLSRQDIQKDFEPPELSVIPLASEESLAQFIGKIEILTNVKVVLGPTNAEMVDTDDFIQQAMKIREEAGSLKTTISHVNGDGLNKEEVVRQVTSAALTGVATVKVNGKTAGNKVDGDNEKFRLRHRISDPPKEIPRAARLAHRIFNGLTDNGTLPATRIEQRVREETQKFLGRFRRPDDDGN